MTILTLFIIALLAIGLALVALALYLAYVTKRDHRDREQLMQDLAKRFPRS